MREIVRVSAEARARFLDDGNSVFCEGRVELERDRGFRKTYAEGRKGAIRVCQV